MGRDPTAACCLRLLAYAEASGNFFADGVDAPWVQTQQLGPQDYTHGVGFTDWTTSRWLEEALQSASLGDFIDNHEHVLPALRMEYDKAEQHASAAGMTPENVHSFMASVWLGPSATTPAP